jgi:hypothetical protein
MEIDIVKEIYTLRKSLISAVNDNPLPTTVKLMIANELVTALSTAEVNELKNMREKEKSTSETKNAEKEG